MPFKYGYNSANPNDQPFVKGFYINQAGQAKQVRLAYVHDSSGNVKLFYGHPFVPPGTLINIDPDYESLIDTTFWDKCDGTNPDRDITYYDGSTQQLKSLSLNQRMLSSGGPYYNVISGAYRGSDTVGLGNIPNHGHSDAHYHSSTGAEVVPSWSSIGTSHRHYIFMQDYYTNNTATFPTGNSGGSGSSTIVFSYSNSSRGFFVTYGNNGGSGLQTHSHTISSHSHSLEFNFFGASFGLTGSGQSFIPFNYKVRTYMRNSTPDGTIGDSFFDNVPLGSIISLHPRYVPSKLDPYAWQICDGTSGVIMKSGGIAVSAPFSVPDLTTTTFLKGVGFHGGTVSGGRKDFTYANMASHTHSIGAHNHGDNAGHPNESASASFSTSGVTNNLNMNHEDHSYSFSGGDTAICSNMNEQHVVGVFSVLATMTSWRPALGTNIYTSYADAHHSHQSTAHSHTFSGSSGINIVPEGGGADFYPRHFLSTFIMKVGEYV